MKKYITVTALVVLIITYISGCEKQIPNTSDGSIPSDKASPQVTIAVSIPPQKTFVSAVAGNLADIIVMIPPGYSPANYQPTPQQMIEFSKAQVYFSIGVPSEKAYILPKASSLNKKLRIVSLAQKVDACYPYRHLSKAPINKSESETSSNISTDRDPHIWLSPKRVIVMINAIKDELIELDPDHKTIYKKNALAYIKQLKLIDKKLQTTLKDLEQKSFIIYHPSFGYFADDYNLNMVPIEANGKESTAKRLQQVIEFAKENDIQFIFYQEEFDSKQAETIASEINGSTIKVSPLSPDYIEHLEYIAQMFKKALK